FSIGGGVTAVTAVTVFLRRFLYRRWRSAAVASLRLGSAVTFISDAPITAAQSRPRQIGSAQVRRPPTWFQAQCVHPDNAAPGSNGARNRRTWCASRVGRRRPPRR